MSEAIGSTHDGSWKPNPGPQTEALQRSEKEILYGGARIGGKTEAAIVWNAEPEYVNHPDFRGLVLRTNEKDLNDYIFRCQRFYGDLCEITKQPAEIRWKAGGVTRMGHWADKDTISKYIGHEYWKISVEEITQCIRTLEEYKMLLGSCRCSQPGIRAQFFATTNPGGPGTSWIKKYFIEKCWNSPYIDPDTGYSRIFIPSKATDNPHADPDYIKWLDGLPEPLRSAWRDGSWELYEGQFFSDFGTHLCSDPFTLSEPQANGQLYGSLDVGTSHPTSYGQWWLAPDDTIWRLFSYDNNGGTHASHAKCIYDKIESFPYTHGLFPEIIWADPSAWTKVRLNDHMVRSPIDEYIDLFKANGKHTRFMPANNDRRNGCQMVRQLLKGRHGTPEIMYFGGGWNTTLVDGMAAVITDKNDQEVYLKQAGDDEADQTRYGSVGCASVLSTRKQSTATQHSAAKVNRKAEEQTYEDL
jgi:hypothetical protein